MISGDGKLRVMFDKLGIGCPEARASVPGESLRSIAAARLKAARIGAGLSQERAAFLLKVDPTCVRRRESGKVDLGALEQLVVLEELTARKGRRAA